ncbi:unnamed protein product [Symbiodinium sp. CCMP2592]|nr:unnamed protein product [Symbiodinium sp. CCMP2592]
MSDHDPFCIPGTEASWLKLLPDGTATCSVCQTVFENARRTDNIARHASSKGHRRRLEELGLVESGEDYGDAPPPSDFDKVARRKPGEALRHGCPGIGGAKKVLKMMRCVCEAMLQIDSSILQEAASILIQLDARQLRLCIRFQAADHDVMVRRGLLGFEQIESLGHQDVANGVQSALRRFCTFNGEVDVEKLQLITQRIEAINADGASDVQLSLNTLRKLWPSVKVVLRDSTHSARRILSRPWSAIDAIHECFQTAISGQGAMARLVQASPTLARAFERFCQEVTDSPASGRRIKNLAMRKHRFDSAAKPLGRFILFCEAHLMLALSLSSNKSHDSCQYGMRFLEWIDEEKLLLLGLLADCSDEALQLVRFYDTEQHDSAEMQYQLQVFASKLQHLFLEGHAFQAGGYAQHVVDILQKPRGFCVQGCPKSLGGPQKVTEAAKERALGHLRLYTRLAIKTLQAEFPAFSLLACFRMFNVGPATRAQAAEDARQLIEGKLSNVDAWSRAVHRTATRQRQVRENYPSGVLRVVLARYAAWTGATTSGVEQFFAKMADHVPSDRNHLTDAHLFTEAKLLSDFRDRDTCQETVCELASEIWKLTSGPPRASAKDRIDAGVPRKKPQDRQRRKRAAETDIVDLDSALRLAESVTEEAVVAQPKVLKELRFLEDKSFRNDVLAFLDNALLESEVPAGLEEVARAWASHEEALSAGHRRRAAQISKIMRPEGPELSRGIYLEKQEWARLPCSRGLNFEARLEDAQVFVVTDAAAPGQKIKWTVALQGGSVVDLHYLRTGGTAGVSFTYAAAVRTKRFVLLSEEFVQHHPGVADIIVTAMGKSHSQWRILDTWEEFAERAERQSCAEGKLVVALALPQTVQQMDMKNIFTKASFFEFITKTRVACSQFGLCGR